MTQPKITPVSMTQYFPDEGITWAGKGRNSEEICLGYETGKLQFVSLDLVPLGLPFQVVESKEAINGVVFHKDMRVVSTRADILVTRAIRKLNNQMLISGGAHGISASKEGNVIASLGNEGLLIAQFDPNGELDQRAFQSLDHSVNFYQTIPIGKNNEGLELFASACRENGLVVTEIGPSYQLGRMTMMGTVKNKSGVDADLVSLCSLNDPKDSTASAMLSADGTLYFVSDLLNNGKMFAWSGSKVFKGTPYSIHSVQGHIFVLMSDKIYAVRDLAHCVIQGSQQTTLPEMMSLEVDAVECSIIGSEFLLIILENDLVRMRVSELFSLSKKTAMDRAGTSTAMGVNYTNFDSMIPILNVEQNPWIPLTPETYSFGLAG